MDPQRLGRIPARMKAFVDQDFIAGAVTLVARHGAVASLEAVGWQDIEAKKPMRTDSIFQVMSMTKPFTSVAIMILVEEGKIALTDPVEKHLPEFRGQMMVEGRSDKTVTLRKPSRPITIRDLLTHTSGMTGPAASMEGLYQKMDRSLAEAVAVFAQNPLEFEPGSRWLYSNTGMATLGRIVEVKGDMPYERFLEERIFKPLGMKDSFFFPPKDKIDRIALVYEQKNGKLVRSGSEILGGASYEYRKGAEYPGPEFALYSTAPDLAAFYEMMRSGGVANGKRLLSRAAVDVMTALHTGDLKAGHLGGTGFGLGWEITSLPEGTLAFMSPGSFGHGGAFGTHGWIDPKKDMVGVFLIQKSGGTDDAKRAFMAMAAAAISE